MHKLQDFILTKPVEKIGSYGLLKLSPADGSIIPEIKGGQFVNVQVLQSHNTFLRRPISVNFVDRKENTLWLLVRPAGDATRHLCEAKQNDIFSILYPLGNGFTPPANIDAHILLCGGGVGIAPMLEWGRQLFEMGYSLQFLLSAKTASDLPMLPMFRKYGTLHLCTDDGSAGLKGFPTQHPVLAEAGVDTIYCCGPNPMMKAVATVAREKGIKCFVSLENQMACGLGACLCCVEDTVNGHACVCKAGPVFDTNLLKW